MGAAQPGRRVRTTTGIALAAVLTCAALAGCGGGDDTGPAATSPTPTPYVPAAAATAVERSVPRGRRVRFRAADGTRLTGTFRAAGRDAPGIVLVHELNGGPQQFDPIVGALRDAGFATLAYRSRDAAELDDAASTSDIRGAVAALRAQPGVDAKRIGLLGASIGAAGVTAAIGTRHDPGVRAAVGLSPPETGDLIAAGRRFKPHDLLLISDESESIDIDGIRKDARGRGVTTFVSPEAGHGVLQLDVPVVRRKLLGWLETRVAGT